MTPDALTDISDVLQHAGVRGHTDKELKLRVRSAKPEAGDQHREDDGAHWIDPPPDFGAEDGSHQTDAVDEQIIAVVFPQDPDLAIGVAQRPAVAEER